MNNSQFKLFDETNKNYILFEYDNEFWIVVSFYNKNNYFFWKLKKIYDIDNNNEICLYKKTDKLIINNLIKFLSEYKFINNENNNVNNENYKLWSQWIIIWCNCVGWLLEHNLIIKDIDDVLCFKLFLYDMSDSILLWKTQTNFIINYLLKYAW